MSSATATATVTSTTDKKVVLITGGNTGLGFALATALLQSSAPTTTTTTPKTSYLVIIASRDIKKAEDAVVKLKESKEGKDSMGGGDVIAVQMDYTDDDSIKKAAEWLTEKVGKIDVLVNNGGLAIAGDDPTAKDDLRSEWATMFDVNVTGTHILTWHLIPLLLRSSEPRLLFITSAGASMTTLSDAGELYRKFNPLPPPGWPKPTGSSGGWNPAGYHCSKAALNILMLLWRNKLESDGVKVFGLYPGFLATGLGGVGAETLKQFGAADPLEGAAFVWSVIEGERDADVGKHIKAGGGVVPW